MPETSLLSQLPPNLLNAITRLLQFPDAYKLGKLSGNGALWTKFRLGGCTELVATTEEAFKALVPLLPTFDFLPNMTHLIIESEDEKATFAPLEPIWANRLPQSLVEIRLKGAHSLRVWLRPFDPATDDTYQKFVANAEIYVPMSMQKHFPNLRVLSLLGPQPEDADMEWCESAVRLFVRGLPPSLSILLIPGLMDTLEEAPAVALSTEVLQGLDELRWSLPVPSSFASLFGCAHVLKPNLSKDEIDNMVLPIINLRALSLTTANFVDDSLFSFLGALTNLQSLQLPLFQSSAGQMKHLAKSKFPGSLTELTIALPVDAPFAELFPPLSNLSSLELTVTDNMDDNADDLVSFKLVLPPSLKKLHTSAATFAEFSPLEQIPSTLTSIHLVSAAAVSWPFDIFQQVTSLRTLELGNISIFDLYRAPLLPSSLTSLITNEENVTLHALCDLCERSKHITKLVVLLTLEAVELDNFVGISTFTLEGISKWLREKPSLTVFDGVHRDATVVEAPFAHLEKLDITLEPLAHARTLGQKIQESVKEIEVPGSIMETTFLTLPDKALTSFKGREDALHLSSVPSTLEILECMTIYANAMDFLNPEPTYIDPTEAQHQPPASLQSLVLDYVNPVIDARSSEHILYPISYASLPHLQTLYLNRILPSQAKALVHLPASLTDLTLAFFLGQNSERYVLGDEEDDEEDEENPPPSLMDLPRDWLPKLTKLHIYKCVLALRDWIHRFPSFDVIQADRFFVHGDALPQVPDSMTLVTDDSLTKFLMKGLPYHARVKSDVYFEYEWNEESMSKLPKAMTSLRLNSEDDTLQDDFPRELNQYLPPTLEALNLLQYSFQHFNDTSLMPRTLKYLEFVVDEVDVQLIVNMPPALEGLTLFRTSDEVLELTLDMAKAFPRTLSVMTTDLVVKKKEVLEALPRNLRSLTLQDAPLQKEAFRAALPPLVVLRLMKFTEDDTIAIKRLAPQLLKDIPTLQFWAGELIQNCLTDPLSPCYPHHPANAHPF